MSPAKAPALARAKAQAMAADLVAARADPKCSAAVALHAQFSEPSGRLTNPNMRKDHPAGNPGRKAKFVFEFDVDVAHAIHRFPRLFPSCVSGSCSSTPRAPSPLTPACAASAALQGIPRRVSA